MRISDWSSDVCSSDLQATVDLQLPPGTSLTEAVTRSGLLQKFPEAAQRPQSCAIFGRAVPLTYELRDGDRIEILRPLDRKSVVEGKSVSVRVDLCGLRVIKKNTKRTSVI